MRQDTGRAALVLVLAAGAAACSSRGEPARVAQAERLSSVAEVDEPPVFQGCSAYEPPVGDSSLGRSFVFEL